MADMFDDVDEILSDAEMHDDDEKSFNESELQDIMSEIEDLEKEFDDTPGPVVIAKKTQPQFCQKKKFIMNHYKRKLTKSLSKA